MAGTSTFLAVFDTDGISSLNKKKGSKQQINPRKINPNNIKREEKKERKKRGAERTSKSVKTSQRGETKREKIGIMCMCVLAN